MCLVPSAHADQWPIARSLNSHRSMRSVLITAPRMSFRSEGAREASLSVTAASPQKMTGAQECAKGPKGTTGIFEGRLNLNPWVLVFVKVWQSAPRVSLPDSKKEDGEKTKLKMLFFVCFFHPSNYFYSLGHTALHLCISSFSHPTAEKYKVRCESYHVKLFLLYYEKIPLIYSATFRL